MRNANIEPWIKTFIKDRNLWVLRKRDRRGPGRALNVSYTEDGLKYTMDKYGTLIACKNAKLVLEDGKLNIVGNTNLPHNVYIEKFVPQEHQNLRDQLVEFMMSNRALKLLYATDQIDRPARNQENLVMVYEDPAGI